MSPDKPDLRLIHGRGPAEVMVNEITLTIAPPQSPPFGTEVKIYEEDTLLVLSAPPIVEAPGEHPVRTLTEVWETKPRERGTLLIRDKRWLAVTHDLDRDPSCDEATVRGCLDLILKTARRNRICSLALPLLGHTHHILPLKDSLRIIFSTLQQWQTPCPSKIWLVCPADIIPSARLLIDEILR